jgi:hypothetical protein
VKLTFIDTQRKERAAAQSLSVEALLATKRVMH